MIVVNGETGEVIQGKIWQYDYGKKLRIQGGNLQKIQEIQFSLSETGGNSVTRVGITKDDVVEITIPDSMLENDDTRADYLIYVFLYKRNETSGETTKKFILNVKARAKLEHAEGTDGNAFGEVIEEIGKFAERAEIAEEKAKQYSLETESDKTEVERLTTLVIADKESVEQTAQNFDNTVQQAKEQINRISTEQINAVREVGTQEVTKVTEEGSKQAQAVRGVGTQEVTKVTKEGNKQVQAVEDKGREVLQSIPPDFTTQMESKLDKQQAVENAGKILEVGKDGTVIPSNKHLQLAIKNTVTKESSIVITDSAEEKLQDFKVIGKSTQDGVPMPDAPQEIKSIGKLNHDTQKYEVDINVTGKNLWKFKSTYSSEKNKSRDHVKEGTLFSLKAGTYTFSCKGTFGNTETPLFLMLSSGVRVEALRILCNANDFKKTFTIDEDAVSVEFISNGVMNGETGTVTDIQLELGSQATTYEEYRKVQEIKLSLNEQLRGIGEYKDTVTKDSIIRKISKIVLNGSEEWWVHNDNYDNIKTNRFFIHKEDIKHSFQKQYTICDKLECNGVFEDKTGLVNDGKHIYISKSKKKKQIL